MPGRFPTFTLYAHTSSENHNCATRAPNRLETALIEAERLDAEIRGPFLFPFSRVWPFGGREVTVPVWRGRVFVHRVSLGDKGSAGRGVQPCIFSGGKANLVGTTSRVWMMREMGLEKGACRGSSSDRIDVRRRDGFVT